MVLYIKLWTRLAVYSTENITVNIYSQNVTPSAKQLAELNAS